MKVVVDTTQEAEFDFAKLNITGNQQEAIAKNLRAVAWSQRDRHYGSLSIREISGYDVAFIISTEGETFAIAIVAVELAGQLESLLEFVHRTAKAELPPWAQAILEGRKRSER